MSNATPGRDCQASTVCASLIGTKPSSTDSKYRVSLEQPNWPSSGVCAEEKLQIRPRKSKTPNDFSMILEKLTLSESGSFAQHYLCSLAPKRACNKKAAPKGRLNEKRCATITR